MLLDAIQRLGRDENPELVSTPLMDGVSDVV